MSDWFYEDIRESLRLKWGIELELRCVNEDCQEESLALQLLRKYIILKKMYPENVSLLDVSSEASKKGAMYFESSVWCGYDDINDWKNILDKMDIRIDFIHYNRENRTEEICT